MELKANLKAKWESIPEVQRERIKEVLRWFVFGVVSAYLRDGEITTTIVQTIILRIVDKVLHLYGKDHDVDFLIKGLTRF